MKKLFFSSIVFLALGACTFTSSTKDEAKTPVAENTLKLSMLNDSKDHACGMSLQDGHIADTTLYNGKVYGFCSAQCKDEFKKDPETLLKK